VILVKSSTYVITFPLDLSTFLYIYHYFNKVNSLFKCTHYQKKKKKKRKKNSPLCILCTLIAPIVHLSTLTLVCMWYEEFNPTGWYMMSDKYIGTIPKLHCNATALLWLLEAIITCFGTINWSTEWNTKILKIR
jgi:hypothetical protein